MKKYTKSPTYYQDILQDGMWPTTIEAFIHSKETYPDRCAFSVFKGNTKEIITYKEAYKNIEAIASHLTSKGLTYQDKIVLIGKNSPGWALGYLAIQFIGAVVVPLDHMSDFNKVIQLGSFSDAKALLCDNEWFEKIKDSPWFSTLSDILSLEKVKGSYPSVFDCTIQEHSIPIQSPSESDIAAILYTSGTTGNEKGVILTHKALMSDAYQAGDPYFLTLTEHDVFYGLLPLHHSYAMTAVFLESIIHGSELLFSSKIVISRNLQEMRMGKVTNLLGIPLLFNKLLAGLFKKVREKGLAAYILIRTLMHINYVFRRCFHINFGKKWFAPLLDGIGMKDNTLTICGGGPLSPKVFRQFQQLGVDFIQGYGLTETAPILTLISLSHINVNSVGQIFPLVEMRIDDPDLFGVGEIQVKGPNICSGYFKDEKGTKELFTPDGFLKTGDLGSIDSKKYVYIKGRAKNLIVTEGGKNVFPEEIEELIYTHDQIEQVVIRSYVPNKATKSELIEALIFPNKEHYTDSNLKESEIVEDIHAVIHSINKKLPPYKRVTKVTILGESLEMTSTKKIKRGKISRTIERVINS